MKPKTLALTVALATFFVGCQAVPEEVQKVEKVVQDQINGMTPAQTVREYQRAVIQKDGKTIKKIAVEERAEVHSHFMDLEKGPQNDYPIPEDSRLKQYREDADTYYFEESHPREDGLVYYEYFQVIRKKDGWKVDEMTVGEFEAAVEGLTPKRIGGGAE